MASEHVQAIRGWCEHGQKMLEEKPMDGSHPMWEDVAHACFDDITFDLDRLMADLATLRAYALALEDRIHADEGVDFLVALRSEHGVVALLADEEGT